MTLGPAAPSQPMPEPHGAKLLSPDLTAAELAAAPTLAAIADLAIEGLTDEECAAFDVALRR